MVAITRGVCLKGFRIKCKNRLLQLGDWTSPLRRCWHACLLRHSAEITACSTPEYQEPLLSGLLTCRLCRTAVTGPGRADKQKASNWVLPDRLLLMTLQLAPAQSGKEAAVRCPSEPSCLNAEGTEETFCDSDQTQPLTTATARRHPAAITAA